MNFRKSRILMWIGFLVAILLMLVPIAFENEKLAGGFFIAGTVIFFMSLLQAFIYYKCPYCGYSLMNVRGNTPKHCPECGAELAEEPTK